MRIAAAKYPADVGADVASGPSNRRRRRRYVGRCFSWQISCQCLSCSQTNRGSEEHKRVLLHHGSSFLQTGTRHDLSEPISNAKFSRSTVTQLLDGCFCASDTSAPVPQIASGSAPSELNFGIAVEIDRTIN